MTRRNVLIFPGGTEIGLEIRASLAYRKEVALFSAAASDSNHAPFAYAHHDIIPPISEPIWFDALCDIAERREIDYVFAAHEDVLLELGRRRSELPATLIAPSQETLELVRSKRSTYAALADIVPVPAILDPADPNLSFPVFVKPDRGAGSRASMPVSCREDLDAAMRLDDDMLVLEYLTGDELTVDCFSDRERGLLFCGPRLRSRMRSGISMDSHPVVVPEAHLIAQLIDERIDLRGAWFFQLRRSVEGDWCLLEVGARVGGTMAVSRVRGANLPWLSILEEERADYSVLLNEFDLRIDRALVNRYRSDLSYSTVYVDLDDTLLLDGQVNPPVVHFIFQAINQGKRIVVITRHDGDPHETLARHRLGSIADEVVHLDRSVPKSSIVTDTDAIFIDDSFGERLDVHERCGIPTFDANMLEVLIDERV